MSPRVSVIIPTRNRADLLPRAVRSALDQTFRDLEVIVVDDGSQDHTRKQVYSFGDPRVRYIRHAQASGASGARNTGLSAAKGEFCAFLDDDDEWFSYKLARQVAFLDSSGTDTGMVGGWMDSVNDRTGERITTRWNRAADDPVESLLYFENVLPFSSSLVRTYAARSVGGFVSELRRSSDKDFALSVGLRFGLTILPGLVGLYHVDHSHAQLTDETKETYSGWMQATRFHMRKFADELATRPLARQVGHRRLIILAAQLRQWRTATREYRQALQCAPSFGSAVRHGILLAKVFLWYGTPLGLVRRPVKRLLRHLRLR